MSKTMTVVLALVAGLAVGVPLGGQLISGGEEMAPTVAPGGFAAVPGEVGAEDLFGPYDVVQDWPKGVQSLPGHEEWTSGAAQGIFAESPDRVYLLAGVSCRTSTDHRPLSSPISDRACSFPSVVCHGAATRRPRFPVPVGRAVTLRADSSPGKTVSAAAYLASTRDGSTASSL